MQIWRVNLRTQQLQVEEAPAAYEKLGGRGLIARILLDEVPPTCDPLGPENHLIFTPGLLVGHMISSCDRLSVGGKSPLTGGVKESNAGGTTGMAMALMNIQALILEGQPETRGMKVLHLSLQGARFDSADDLIGTGVYESAEKLRARYGDQVSISLIGPAGERRMLAAGVFNLDKDRVPSRVNARGGLGALMGAKGLKAIVFDAEGGKKPAIQDIKTFKAAQKTFTQALMAHPQTAIYRDFSTAGVGRMCNSFGALPVRGFSEGQFEAIEEISGENLRQVILKRGGKADPSHACMPGCTIRCSNVFTDEQDQILVAPLEYETIGLMGSNLGIGSFEAIARLNWVVNDLGLDTIETGASLGVAAQADLMMFGDEQSAMRLIEEIRNNTPMGQMLGNGAAYAGKALGVQRVPVVKGQAMAAYDPRAIKGNGVTYATNPQGADHTAGQTIRMKIDHLSPEGKVDASRTAQINSAGYDTLGACIFAGSGFASAPETIRDLLNARYGWSVGADILQVLGKQTLADEREFNRLAGFTAADDRIPAWMMVEPLAPTQAVFDVPDEELDQVFNWS